MSCTFFGRSTDFRCFNSRLIASAPSRVMGILSDAIGASDRGAARNEYGRTPQSWGPGRVRATFARCGASVNGDRIDPRGVAAIDRWAWNAARNPCGRAGERFRFGALHGVGKSGGAVKLPFSAVPT